MERNANDNLGNQNTSDASSGAGFGGSSVGSQGGSQGSASGAGYGGSSSGTTGTGGYGGSMNASSSPADASFSRDTSSESGGITDRAKSAMGTAQEKLADAGSTVREKAGTWKNSLADALESGADKLRQQGAGGGQMAGAAATGESVGMIADQPNRMAGMSNQLAGGMQASADWLRDADLDGIKSGIEQQVKDHPGRTLAVAVGLGYLLGKAIRK